MTMTALALSTTLHTTFDDAVTRTRKALADNGFGVLTEIDVKATMKAKLDADMADYLGACNPPLAYQAVLTDPEIGLFLPCNVVVRADTSHGDDTVIVDAINPELMAQLSDAPAMEQVAQQVTTKLQAVIDALGGQ